MENKNEDQLKVKKAYKDLTVLFERLNKLDFKRELVNDLVDLYFEPIDEEVLLDSESYQ